MKFDIGTELETLGLSPNEAKVYLASLKVGASTAQLLAAKATISRPTTYIMIESLVKRGLMSSYFKGKKKYFSAANPNQLVYIVNNLKRDALEKEAAVGKIIDALGKMVDEEKAAMVVRIIDGQDCIQELQRDILDSGASETFELVNIDEVRQWIPPVYKGDIREKLVLKCKTRSLYICSTGKITDRQLPAGSRHEARFLDAKRYPLRGNVVIFADRVAYISFGTKNSAIIIRDGGLAETMKTMFNALWDKGEQE